MVEEWKARAEDREHEKYGEGRVVSCSSLGILGAIRSFIRLEASRSSAKTRKARDEGTSREVLCAEMLYFC